jgi:hypothetical protein
VARRIAMVLAAALVAACGGGGSAETSGTCDWTALTSGTLEGKCLEQSGPAAAIADQRAACLSTQGSWTPSPCPAGAARLGCCTYHFGLDFRECWYARDPPHATDPEVACSTVSGTWNPG